MTARVMLGTQGWSYAEWVGPFYPEGTRPAEMLSRYAHAFETVEVDSTFYGIPPDPVVRGWRERVPTDFVFSLKVPQMITHERRLTDAGELLATFVERAHLLGQHLGPLLIQLSPAFRRTEENKTVLKQFLETLPDEFRWAIEFRDQAWMAEETLDLLRRRNVALALVDARWIRRSLMLKLAGEPTADFAYLRWLGASRALSDFSRVQVERDRELWMWVGALAQLSSRVTDVFGYVNNQFQGHGPHSVRELQRMVGQTPVQPESLREQVELF